MPAIFETYLTKAKTLKKNRVLQINTSGIKNLFFILCLLFSFKSQAQDPHFSQFYNAPLTLNPAMTGLINDDVRVIANYKNQWYSVTVPFQTISASAELSLLQGFSEDDFIGLGIILQNDKAGDSNLRNTQAHLSFAYHKALSYDGNNFLTIGAQAGFANQDLNFNSLLFDSQYNGDIIDPGQASGESFMREGYSYFDVGAGLAWTFSPTEEFSFYSGVAALHLNEPSLSFINKSDDKLYRKYSVYLGADFRLSELFSIIPRGVFLQQGPASELNLGGLMRFNIGNNDRRTAFTLGTMHRLKDAQVIISRFDYGSVGLSFSYDINISKLSAASAGQGGPELALIYRSTFFQEDKRSRAGAIRCPDM